MTRYAGEIADHYYGSHGQYVQIDPAVLAAVRAAAGGPVPVQSFDSPTQALPPLERRRWGWQVQLYQLRSAGSWGIGDYADLARLATGLGELGAQLILVNPLHAETPVPPFGDSPYFPSSRRFVSMLSISIPALPEYRLADDVVRSAVDALAPPNGPRIDRPAVWAAKLAALAMLAPPEVAAGQSPRLALGEPDADEVQQYAVFCALAEAHGPDWRTWPAALLTYGPAARAEADPARVAFHVWAQVRARQQLAAAQEAATRAGMSVGIVHDLAVGVDPGGADGWLFSAEMAPGVAVGAPPDDFNEHGQNWGLPAWRPDRLAAERFEPWREVVATALRLGGGLRIDHILGLYRMWWVPADAGAGQGAYVSFDVEAMLRVLVGEAHRCGGLLIGEDLGVVNPDLQRRMAELGVLGSAVLWFEGLGKGEGRQPRNWRREAAASVSTHDLPTAYGYLRDEQVRARESAGILQRPLDDAFGEAAWARGELMGLLKDAGVLDWADEGDPEKVVEAMYRALLTSPSEVVLVSAADAVGDIRQPNLPGTLDEYPNWRLPLADGNGELVSVEAFLAAPGTARLSALMRDSLG